MLDCKKIQGLLGEYVDDALASEDAWRVKLHLASCAVCDQAARELSGTVALLQSLPRQDTPAGFEQALARRLADVALQPRQPSFAERVRDAWTLPRRARRPATLGALLAALVPVAVLVVTSANRTATLVPPAATVPGVPAASVTHRAAAMAPGADFVQQCLDEHSTYAAADPLGDQTAVILASLSSGNTMESEDR
jgi:anti-sigma factor RsiW